MRILRAVAALFLAITLAGCATTHKQAFNKVAHQDVKTIGLLEPACSGEYVVQNHGHVGMGFGLVGGLIAAADMQSKTDQFTELMKVRRFNLADEVQNTLAADLQKTGYMVKILGTKREKQHFLESYDGLPKDVDAYLDLTIGAGYMCASGTSDYIPTVRSQARLIRRETKEILYEEVISYGYENRHAEAVSIAADSQHFFKDFDVLSGEADRAMDGLKRGVPLVTRRIAEDLTR